MFRTPTPEERAQAQAQNDEQAAAHIAHNLNSPMVSDATRKAIADRAAAAATYAAETLTTKERKEQADKDRAAMRELCTSAKYPEDGPNLETVRFSQEDTPADYEEKVAAMSEDDKRQAMSYALAQANTALESRGKEIIDVRTSKGAKEWAQIINFCLAKRMSLLDPDNILVAFAVLCSEAGMRRPTAAEVKVAVAQAVVAAEERNPFPPGDEHNQWDRNLRDAQARKEVEAAELTAGPNTVRQWQGLQGIQSHLGLAIDSQDIADGEFRGRTVDSLSSTEYLRYESKRTGKNIGTPAQRFSNGVS